MSDVGRPSWRRRLPPLLAPGARVVVESDRRAPLRLLAPVDRERRYGDTTITIHSLTMSAAQKSIAICPGSYDPVTNGHLDVIRRAAALYDEVVVAVVNRSVRKSSALFGIEDRVGFIERRHGGPRAACACSRSPPSSSISRERWARVRS